MAVARHTDAEKLTAPYVYAELLVEASELRLVALQPGSYHDDLRCSIVHCR